MCEDVRSFSYIDKWDKKGIWSFYACSHTNQLARTHILDKRWSNLGATHANEHTIVWQVHPGLSYSIIYNNLLANWHIQRRGH